MWKCKEWWNNQLTLGIWFRLLSQHHLPLGRHQPHLSFFCYSTSYMLFVVIDTFISQNMEKMNSNELYTCHVNARFLCTIQQGVITLFKKDKGCAKIDSKVTFNVVLLLVLILLIKLMTMQLFFWLIFLIYFFCQVFQILGCQ